MHIGIDFDNTIAGYETMIRSFACENDWIEASKLGGKRSLRDGIRQLPGGEQKWMILQAEIYGPRMGEAELIDGVDHFLRACLDKGEKVSIISHKTTYANASKGGVDLRKAALAWMERKEFFTDSGFGLDTNNVHFADTRREKCQMIGALGCNIFIDDLYEVFADLNFPQNVKKILFETEPGLTFRPEMKICASWSEILDSVYGGGSLSG